ncbi:DUF3108 domain-containing protein [Galbibacter mesophilus]|uniref:DUF3108 domain-containing protein n=1 Tax=Galbibacter mesophilus TaxID=379069 RepID=UPI00191DC703|nr:DUF3108 domain-containing protein [Galbibacter mesophilus]MCM5663563.1 DUF3108 domain-containing protein [Galbibacter mesophilus]
MKRIVFGLLLFSVLSIAQENTTIKPNEKLVYTASYNMSGLLTNIAQVTMETSEVKTSKSTLLNLRCKAVTFSKWDSYFRIRDVYESYVNPKNLKPLLYKRDIDEGGYKKQIKYTFSYSKGTVKSVLNKKKIKDQTRTISIGANTSDIVSTIYQLRNLNFENMKAGESKNVTILFDNKEYPVKVKYMTKETVDAGPLGKKSCYKLSISAKTDALRGKDENLIWLTADNKKIPAQMKFNIPVGTGQLKLTSASGL